MTRKASLASPNERRQVISSGRGWSWMEIGIRGRERALQDVYSINI